MKIISWNTNARSNKEILKNQCEFLDCGNFDVITLQEITEKSQIFFKEHFKDYHLVSSFDLSKDLNLLKRKRKYGEIIISKQSFEILNPYRIDIPFQERVLSIKFLNGLEIYTTHVPPGSSNGVIKVKHFEGLFSHLIKDTQNPKILTGDFNSPKEEFLSGEVVTWGQKINKDGKVRLSVNPKWKDDCTAERWDAAERGIIEKHSELGMKDAFRVINGYEDNSCSWFLNRKDVQLGRRYDHVFCSNELEPIKCLYDHNPRLDGLSDHSPIIAEIS